MIVTNPFTRGTWTREQIDTVSRGWWVLLVSGILGVVAGGVILFVHWTVGDLAVFIGALLVIRGFFTTLAVPLDGAARGWAVALGVLEMVVGLAVWIWPGPTLLVVAFWIGWYVLFSGIMTIAGAISGRNVMPYWGLTLALGIVETLFAFWLLARPGLTLVAAVLALGLWSTVYGVVQIALAFDVKQMPARADELGRDVNAVSSHRRFDAAAS